MNYFALSQAPMGCYCIILNKKVNIELYVFRYSITLLVFRNIIQSIYIKYSYNYNLLKYFWVTYAIVGGGVVIALIFRETIGFKNHSHPTG